MPAARFFTSGNFAKPLVSGYSGDTDFQIVRIEMASGLARQRARGRIVPTIRTLSYYLTAQEFRELIGFFALVRGTYFLLDMKSPDSPAQDSLHTVRLVSTVRSEALDGGGRVFVSFDVEFSITGRINYTLPGAGPEVQPGVIQ